MGKVKGLLSREWQELGQRAFLASKVPLCFWAKGMQPRQSVLSDLSERSLRTRLLSSG